MKTLTVTIRIAVPLTAAVSVITLILTCSPPIVAQAFSDQTTASNVIHTQDVDGMMPGHPMDAGGTVGDFNNDGLPDLFLLGGGGGSEFVDALSINNGDGIFTDEAVQWGVDVAHRGQAATAGDYNKDGWLDIFVTSGTYTSTSRSDNPNVGRIPILVAESHRTPSIMAHVA